MEITFVTINNYGSEGALARCIENEFEWRRSLSRLATKRDLLEMEIRMADTQEQLAVELDALTVIAGKVALEQSTRFDTLTARIAELTEVINAGGAVTPRLNTALTNLRTAVAELDAAIPDAPAPTE